MSDGFAYRHASTMNGLRDRKPQRFTIREETLIVRVRESPRARTKRIIVGPRRPLEVIVPRRTSDDEVAALLEDKRGWIERKVVASREIAARPPKLGLEQPGVVWLAGEQVAVERREGLRPIATLNSGMLIVGGSDGTAADALERWYRRQARRRVQAVAAREAERLDLRFHSIAIRDPRTRWGSCSRRGNLSFSWRLAAAPPEVLEYVVVHELCHLREPSHQKPFWRLLESARPGWREEAHWLREHGQELHDYTPVKALAREPQSSRSIWSSMTKSSSSMPVLLQ
jgi:predicted metal-dependent hydrolase